MPLSPRVALATCAEFPDLDADDQLLVPALAALGIEGVPMVWTEPFTDWSAFDLVVVRSTWDYPSRRDEFLTWAHAVPKLANPAAALEWSSDKHYLAELQDARLPTVPTMFLTPGAGFPELEAEVVVKPAVGAGSIGARRFKLDERPHAASHAATLHAQRHDVMVQPYLRGVEDGRGETALVYLAGVFSHAIHKGPLLQPTGAQVTPGALFLEEAIETREPTEAELAVGARVMSWLAERFGTLLYARIDLLPALGGHLVLEIELVEPSLFLATSPGAPQRLAKAIAALL